MDKEEKKTFEDFMRSLKPYLIIVLVVILIRTFIITPGVVNGESMENTLFDGNYVLVNKIGLLFGLDRFDVVVVKLKGSKDMWGNRSNDDTIIKRVIALEGDKISIAKHGDLNGEYRLSLIKKGSDKVERIEEDYIKSYMETKKILLNLWLLNIKNTT